MVLNEIDAIIFTYWYQLELYVVFVEGDNNIRRKSFASIYNLSLRNKGRISVFRSLLQVSWYLNVFLVVGKTDPLLHEKEKKEQAWIFNEKQREKKEKSSSLRQDELYTMLEQ